jgi:hypothetical protein
MVLAQAQPGWVMPTVLVITLVVLGLFGWFVLRFYRWLKRLARLAQQRVYEGLMIYPEPGPGLVSVVFHTYYGFVAFVTQTDHQFWASPDDARLVLWRLHRFNLTWGLFAPGMVLIPILSLANYLVQRRSIRKQEEKL